jgi:hypothetical protein
VEEERDGECDTLREPAGEAEGNPEGERAPLALGTTLPESVAVVVADGEEGGDAEPSKEGEGALEVGMAVRLSVPAPALGLREGAGELLPLGDALPLPDGVGGLLLAMALRLDVPPIREAVAQEPVGDAEGQLDTERVRVPVTEAQGQGRAVAVREGLEDTEGLREGRTEAVMFTHTEGVCDATLERDTVPLFERVRAPLSVKVTLPQPDVVEEREPLPEEVGDLLDCREALAYPVEDVVAEGTGVAVLFTLLPDAAREGVTVEDSQRDVVSDAEPEAQRLLLMLGRALRVPFAAEKVTVAHSVRLLQDDALKEGEWDAEREGWLTLGGGERVPPHVPPHDGAVVGEGAAVRVVDALKEPVRVAREALAMPVVEALR